jgi:hypothetical protein
MAGRLNDETLRWNLEVNGDQAQKELSDLDSNSRQLSGTNKSLRLELQKMEAAGKKNTQEYKNLQQQIKSNNQTLEQNKAKTKELTNQLGLTALTLRQLRSRFTELKSQMDNTRPGTAEWKKYKAELESVQNRINQVNTGTQKSNAVFGMLKSALPALGIGAVVTGLVSLGKEFFNLSKGMEQADRKARIVFGNSLPEVSAAAAENARQMGLTRNEYVKAAGNIADLLVPLGFARDKAAELSITTTNLSGALDEWSGGTLGAAEVNNILTKAMLGETDQMKQLGIVIDQSSKEYNARIDVLMKTQGVTKEQARALDILAQMQQKSVDAQTSFAQQGTTLLRVQKDIVTGWRQMKENIVGYFQVPMSEKISREKDNLNLLVSSVMSVNDNQAVRLSLIQDLQKAYPGFLGNLEAEKVTNEDLRKRLDEVNQEYDKKIKFQVYQEELVALEEKSKENQRLINNHIKSINSDYEKYIGLNADNMTYQEKALALQNQKLDNSKLETDGYLDVWEAQKQVTQGAANSLEQITLLETNLNEIQKERTDILKDQSKVAPPPDPGGGGGGGGGETDEQKKERERKEKELNDLHAKQKEYGDKVILDAMNARDKENKLYEQRLNDAGIFEVSKTKMTAQQLKVAEALEIEHAANLKAIDDKEIEDKKKKEEELRKKNEEALKKELQVRKDVFDYETKQQELDHESEMLALGDNEKAKTALDKKFKAQQLDRQKQHVENLLKELQDIVQGQDVFQGIDESILSDEQKAELEKNIAELRLKLQELGIDVQKLNAPEKKEEGDLLGMTPSEWKNLFENLKNGELTLDNINSIAEAIQEAWSIASEIWTSINDIQANQEAKAMMEYEANIEKRKDLLKKQLDAGKISQESYNKQIAGMDADLDKKKKDIAIKQAKREKALALTGAIVNTALAIVKALGTMPPWLGIALAVVAGIMGGLQITKIATTPIPQYAEGKYDVIGNKDGKKYNAGVINSPGTGLLNSPTILAGELPEIIIDPYTTRNLQMNRPDVIEAINRARVHQFASGLYPTNTVRETTTIREAPAELNNVLAELKGEIRELRSRLDKGIGAQLVADSDYIRTHNKVAEDYQDLRNQAGMRG